MNRFFRRLCLTGLAAGALMSSILPASAAGVIYGAGSTLPFGLYRDIPGTATDAWFDTFAGVAFGAANGSFVGDCNPAINTCIAYAALGSGTGLAAFLAQQSQR